ncbi:MAG: AMP-binding protein [Wujia sp.]
MNSYQKKILDVQRFYPGTAVGNIGGILDLEVSLSYEEICEILQEIVKSTTALRLRLSSDFEMYEYQADTYQFDKVSVDGGYEEALEFAKQCMSIPFASMVDSDLYDLKVIQYEAGKRSMILLKMHHLIGDGVTVSAICNLFGMGYDKRMCGEPFACPDYSAQYPVLPEKKEAQAKAYFEEKLSGYEPIKLSEKESADCKAGKCTFTVETIRKNRIVDLLSALYTYMRTVTDSNKIVIGFVLANRKKSDLDKVGMYANTLPLVLDFEGETCEELQQEISSEVMQLLRYSAYSMDDRGLYDLSFTYRLEEYIPSSHIGTGLEIFSGCVDAPIRISASEKQGKVIVDIFYQEAVFSRDYIENMGRSLMMLMDRMETASRMSELEVLTERDKQMYRVLNDTQSACAYTDLMDVFAGHVSSDQTLIWKDGSLTGKELQTRCRKIAGLIQNQNAKRVGLRMKRSHEMIEAAVGALMAGAAFMVISDQIADMGKYCDLILDEKQVRDLYQSDDTFIAPKYQPDAPAYLICTSGTTGKPKCIAISRKSILLRLEWAHRKYGLDGTILQKTVNTFDVSVWEMLSVLYGARLCLLEDGEEKLPDRITQAILTYQIEKIHFVPSMLRRFLRFVKTKQMELPSLKKVFASGEKLERDLVESFYSVFEDCELINLYGPAECSIDVTAYECSKSEKHLDIPIGTPVDCTQILILNQKHQCLPVGVPGEICILGDLVGAYYPEDETDRFFFLHGKKAYKTGDIGMLGFDGQIYIQGRKDQEIKIRGMRVNLSEIGRVLRNMEGIRDVVIGREGNRLVCFYVGDASVRNMQRVISKQISAYAVPSLFCQVDQIPLNANGKADVKQLLAQRNVDTDVKETCQQDTEEMNELQEKIYHAVRPYVQLGLDDNLFEAGLDSISVLDIVCDLQEQGCSVDFGDFYENLTIRNIAEKIKESTYYTYLKKTQGDTLLICVPYAAGEPQNFSAFAEKCACDVIGIYTSSYEENQSVEDIAHRLCKALPVDMYQHVYVYGHCVGAMLAMEIATQISEIVKGLILVSPSIRSLHAVRKSNPWRKIGDAWIARVLRLAGGGENYTENVLSRFRRDTDRFFAYSPSNITIGEMCKVVVVYGSRDLFTISRKKITKQIQQLIGKEVVVEYIKDAKHFLNEEDPDRLYHVIKSTIKKI